MKNKVLSQTDIENVLLEMQGKSQVDTTSLAYKESQIYILQQEEKHLILDLINLYWYEILALLILILVAIGYVKFVYMKQPDIDIQDEFEIIDRIKDYLKYFWNFKNTIIYKKEQSITKHIIESKHLGKEPAIDFDLNLQCVDFHHVAFENKKLYFTHNVSDMYHVIIYQKDGEIVNKVHMLLQNDVITKFTQIDLLTKNEQLCILYNNMRILRQNKYRLGSEHTSVYLEEFIKSLDSTIPGSHIIRHMEPECMETMLKFFFEVIFSLFNGPFF